MDKTKSPFFNLAVGPVTIGIRFDAPGYTESFAEYFTGYESSAPADIMLDFFLVVHEDFPDIPESLVQAKKWGKNSFTIGDELFAGSYDADAEKWNITVKSVMTKGQITRVFEQFLYQAFYSACAKSGKTAYLVHSSSVSVGNNGFIFVGASGMGKSTVAELSKEYGVLNDEIGIIYPDGDALRLDKSPFNAYFCPKAGIPARLRAVFLLRHAAECRLEPVSRAQAVAEITGQVVPPIGLEDTFDPAVASSMMAVALDLAGKVPVYHLYFPVEGGFWPLIQNHFSDLRSPDEQ